MTFWNTVLAVITGLTIFLLVLGLLSLAIKGAEKEDKNVK